MRGTEFLVNEMLPLFSFGLLNAGSLVSLNHSLHISGMKEKASHLVLVPCFLDFFFFKRYLRLKSNK